MKKKLYILFVKEKVYIPNRIFYRMKKLMVAAYLVLKRSHIFFLWRGKYIWRKRKVPEPRKPKCCDYSLWYLNRRMTNLFKSIIHVLIKKQCNDATLIISLFITQGWPCFKFRNIFYLFNSFFYILSAAI
jgi:hypothetical protein